MTKWTSFAATFALFAALLMAGAPAMADESAADITGKWKGTGYVQKDETSRPVKVR